MMLVKKVAPLMALVALAACTTVSDMWSGVGDMWSGGKTANVRLTGAEENPPVSTKASGNGSITVAKDGAVKGSVTTTGVQGTMAHIHRGAKGTNGGVALGLTKNGDTYSVPDGAKLNEADQAAFKAGNLYVNVHSAANKGGEVRGQLQP
jgi:hypothetical protein